MNLSPTFSAPAASLWLIAAALGAITGLYLFFHGFSLLQQKQFEHARGLLQKTVHAATPAAVAVPESDTSKRDSHAEVIHLSPCEEIQIDSASMTQQGKIAAALLRAGIQNPVTTSANRLRTGDADLPASESVTPQAINTEVARVLQNSANASEISLPSLRPATLHPSARWKATIMIWGGPALTLACIYLLAARLGWL